MRAEPRADPEPRVFFTVLSKTDIFKNKLKYKKLTLNRLCEPNMALNSTVISLHGNIITSKQNYIISTAT